MLSIRSAIEDYQFALKRLAKTTQREYLSKLYQFADWCERQKPPISLETLKQAVIRRFMDDLRDNINPRSRKPITAITIDGYGRVLKAWIKWLSKEDDYEDIISEKLARRIERPRVETKVLEIYSDEQIREMFKAIAADKRKVQQVRDKAIISVLLDSGIRANELCCLTLENCILSPHEGSYLRVFGKGQKWRQVPLGLSSAIALRRYVERYRQNNGNTVFLSMNGTPLTVNGLNQLLRRVLRKAGIDGMERITHCFRHTMAVRYLQHGGDVYPKPQNPDYSILLYRRRGSCHDNRIRT